MKTQGTLGSTAPFAVDTLALPHDNPWKSLLCCGGHDFLPDGSLVVCTMQGDVWRVAGIDDTLASLQWRRIAAGLHQPLGLLVVDVLATGLRNPDGIGITPAGLITASSSEGEWVPASLIAAVPAAHHGAPLHFGHGGLRDGRPPALPLAYLPRGEDNSAGGQGPSAFTCTTPASVCATRFRRSSRSISCSSAWKQRLDSSPT